MKKNLFWMAFLSLIIGVGPLSAAQPAPGQAAAGDPYGQPLPPQGVRAPSKVFLQIEIGRDKRIILLDDLKKQLPSSTVKVFNASYQRKLAYRGFWLEDILQANHFPKGKEAQILFVCRDGYTAFLSNSWVGRHKWLLAYGETSGRWTPLVQGSQIISPGPWYLIGSKKGSFGDFPWPYAVAAIKSVNSW